MTDTPKASQWAREAAAAEFDRTHCRGSAREAELGNVDDHPLVQAFARFERETLKRAAKIAESWGDPILATPHENQTYRSIAHAIRSIGGNITREKNILRPMY